MTNCMKSHKKLVTLAVVLSVSLTLNLVAGIATYLTISENYHLMQVAVEKPQPTYSADEVELSRIFNNN